MDEKCPGKLKGMKQMKNDSNKDLAIQLKK